MSYKDESNKNIGFLLISIGLLALFSGIDNIFNIDEYKPDFHGRWGWFTYFLYSEFGVYGQPVYMVFGGGFFLYFGIMKLK